jgi:hypothetical protein
VTVRLVLLGVAGLLTVPLLWRALRLAHQHQDWNISSTLTFGFGTLLAAPGNLAMLAGARIQTTDSAGESRVIYAGWYAPFTKLVTIATIFFALVLLVDLLRRDRYLDRPGMLAVLLAGYCGAIAWTLGYSPKNLPYLGLMAALLVVSAAPKGRGGPLGAATFAALQIIITSFAALVLPAHATVACRQDKCGPAGVLVTGSLGNENAMGLLLAAAIPLIWLGFRDSPARWIAVIAAVGVYTTGSRTASVAGAAAILTLLMSRPDFGRPDISRWRSFVPKVFALVGAVAVVVVPLVIVGNKTFTGRPYLWRVANDYIAKHVWLGNGQPAWRGLFDRGLIPKASTYSAHNQWLDVLFIGGWVGAAIFLAMLASLFLPRSRHKTQIVLALLMPMIWGGITERLWGIAAIDWLTFSLLATLTAVSSRKVESDATLDDHADQRGGLAPGGRSVLLPSHL